MNGLLATVGMVGLIMLTFGNGLGIVPLMIPVFKMLNDKQA